MTSSIAAAPLAPRAASGAPPIDGLRAATYTIPTDRPESDGTLEWDDGTGVSIDDPTTCDELVERALEMPGPVLIEAVVDPLEPPLPARITPTQAVKFAESLIRGEPQPVAIARNALGEKVREMV